MSLSVGCYTWNAQLPSAQIQSSATLTGAQCATSCASSGYRYGMITNDEFLPIVQPDNKFSCFCANSISSLSQSGSCYASCPNGDACGSRNLKVPFVPLVTSVSVYQAVAPAPVSAPTTFEAPNNPVIPSPPAPQKPTQEIPQPQDQVQTTKGPTAPDAPAQQVESPSSSDVSSNAASSQSNSATGVKAIETRAAAHAALDATDKKVQETSSSKSGTPVAASNSQPDQQQQSPLMPFAIVGILILLLCLVGVGICVFRARASRSSDDEEECGLSRSNSTQTNIFKEKGFSVDLKAAMIRGASKSSRSLQRSDHSATLVGSPNRATAFNKCHTVMSSTSSVLRLNSYYQRRELA
ncbi:hypothetical protein BJ741DRAFT_620814 [Chytriomyces cf. hyalinus JEL632]|nr:hypothetical protein BJ741DRAFT_620814 [Chytriomyces cf. hyalinus JEL632]